MIEVEEVSFVGNNETSIRLIRNTVFSGEQNVDPAIDFDGKDLTAFHSLVFVDGQPAGTGRMLADGHLGRIAILKEYRGEGLGSKIIESLTKIAVVNGYGRVYLGSQKHAIKFYEKLGFTPFGDEYVEANIEHISMEQTLI
ncbi:MAG: putative GNAT family N-acyltransferase [Shewanella sp.]|jgi:predicted GNAT family N-acyltransferase